MRNLIKEKLSKLTGLDFLTKNPMKLSIQDKKYIIYSYNIGQSKANNNRYRITVSGLNEFHFEDGYITLILGYNKNTDMIGIIEAINYDGMLPLVKSFWFDKLFIESNKKIQYDEIKQTHYTKFNYFIKYLTSEFLPSEKPIKYARFPNRPNKGIGKTVSLNDSTRLKRPKKIRSHTFRYDIINAYSNKCVILGKNVPNLKAAHIIDVISGKGNDSVKNGMLMNHKHHIAFDHGRLVILPDGTYYNNPENLRTIDLTKKRKKLKLPREKDFQPKSSYFIDKLKYLGFKIPKEVFEMIEEN